MKKILCVLMLALMLMGTALAEEEFPLWHDLRFGMSQDEILIKCKNITDVLDGWHQKPSIDSGPDMKLDKYLTGNSMYFLYWQSNEHPNDYIKNIIGIADIPLVNVYFGFDDYNGMKHLLFVYKGYDATIGQTNKPTKDLNKATREAYDSLSSRLKVKYGMSQNSSNKGLPQFDGGVLTLIKNSNLSFAIDKMTEWLISINDGNYVKIECVLAEVSDGIGKNYYTLWSYSFIAASEVNESLSIYDDL